MKKISEYLQNPWLLLSSLAYHTADLWPDELFLKILFRARVGYHLNLKNPKSYNEKLQWLKLNCQHPEYKDLVDKASAKQYASRLIGEKYIIPTLGIWDTVDDIEWDSLPNRFVIKCTGDSGGVVICKDKNKLDINKAKKKLLKGWGHNYYSYNREYPYRYVKNRIIAEEYMEDESGYELKDYKIFCFDGEPKYLFVATDRQKKGEDTKFDFFDLEWNHIPVENGHPNNPNKIEKPLHFEKMIEIARRLSQGMVHVRVDLYNCNGNIYFGELTFFHWSGMTAYNPIEWDYKFGKYIKLPITTNRLNDDKNKK